MKFSFRSVLKDLTEESNPETDIPARAVEWVMDHDPELAAKMLLPMARAEYARMQRYLAREAEDAAYANGDPFDDVTQRNRPTESELQDRPVFDPVERRRKLLREEFYSPHSEMNVTWGEASAADHRARARHQRALSQTVLIDAKRHESAARHLDANRVKNLNELHDQLMQKYLVTR